MSNSTLTPAAISRGMKVCISHVGKEQDQQVRRMLLELGAIPTEFHSGADAVIMRDTAIRELSSLAAQVIGEEVSVVSGKPGCMWSWNWNDRSHPVVIVLSDGEHYNEQSARAEVQKLKTSGIPCVGIGIGPETHNLRKLFQHSLTGISAKEAALRVAKILRAAVVQHALAA